MSLPDFPSATREPAAVQTESSRLQGDVNFLSPCGEQVPLVDQRALRELGEDFDSPTVVQDFARDFVQSWEGKYQRLAVSIHQGDQMRAKEAVLSVKVTSIMVGAVRLAHLAVHLEQLIENKDMDAATRSLACVEACGSETRTELLETYIR